MQIVFMGTPDFAVGALEALITQGHEITAVVTQPDKPKGRSKELQFPPVKECAVKHGIPVFQPRRIKTPEAIEELKKYPADIYIVAAFGQILSQEILDLPKYGCLNIHASLLPKYRGASPIQRVIIDGEAVTHEYECHAIFLCSIQAVIPSGLHCFCGQIFCNSLLVIIYYGSIRAYLT